MKPKQQKLTYRQRLAIARKKEIVGFRRFYQLARELRDRLQKTNS